jgi:hypothetical protein
MWVLKQVGISFFDEALTKYFYNAVIAPHPPAPILLSLFIVISPLLAVVLVLGPFIRKPRETAAQALCGEMACLTTAVALVGGLFLVLIVLHILIGD